MDTNCMADLEYLGLPPAHSVVAVAMSGGVDSSLTALLMARHGCTVVGVTMKVYDSSIAFPAGTGNGCYGPGEEEDEESCRSLCGRIGAEYHTIDLSSQYAKEVLGYFKDEYRKGRTPNPCLRCNPLMKFGLMPRMLRERGVGFDFFVTGHYVRLMAPRGDAARGVYLAPAVDGSKDQSYFLQRLTQAELRTARFPLGSMTKVEVRAMARAEGLETADKPDSQDFIAPEDYGPLFSDLKPENGDIVLGSGDVLGKHRGIVRYTVGQRRGLGVSIGPEPLYVLSLDAKKNRVVVGPEDELFASSLEAEDPRWSPGFGTVPFRCYAKIRLASKPAPALVTPLADGGVRVDFDAPQRAIAPGQSAAFYVPRSHPGGDGKENENGTPGDTAHPSSGISRSISDTILAGGAVIERALPQRTPPQSPRASSAGSAN